MQQRSEFITEWRSETMSFVALCELYGISRQTGYKWVRRWRDERSVEEKSRRPVRSPGATPPRLIRRILSQKKQFPLWGPIPLRHRLKTLWPQERWPAASTIGAILKRHDMVRPRRTRRRAAPRTQPFSHAREPNDIWCVDFKGHFTMGDGRVCYPLTIMDAASRFLIACVAFHSPSRENVEPVFLDAFKRHGLPKAIRSDNGEPFASTSTAAGFTQLSAWWARLGIRLERIDPGKPQQNGRHERMHLTLKEATCAPPRSTLRWQQRAFDRFRHQYNELRPHQALGLATPASRYANSRYRYPETLALPEYPLGETHQVRRDGTIDVGQRRQFITTALAGELVGLYTRDERYIEVVYAGVLLGLIDLRNNNANPKRGLIRPRPPNANRRSSRVSAMSPV